jgi:splicing factor 4
LNLKYDFNVFVYVPVQDLKGLGYKKGKPLGLVGVTELSEDQRKQLKEQQEV